jgi:two-component system response regulator NreC
MDMMVVGTASNGVEAYEAAMKLQPDVVMMDISMTGENDIISRFAKGYSNKEIGESLYLSVKTVEAHKSKIMDKLQLRTRQKLVSYVFKHGLLHFD